VSRAAAFKQLNELTWRVIVGIVVGALLSGWLAWLFGDRLIRQPVADLVALTRQWRTGDLQARSGLRGPMEFGQLGEGRRSTPSPTTSIARWAQGRIAQRDDPPGDEQLADYLGLIAVQARAVRDPEATRKFDQAVGRINSVALAYRRMHAAGGVETMDFATFVRELCQDLHRSMMLADNSCAVEADSVLLGPDQAMPPALIVYELVTNAVKHGGGPEAQVTIKSGHSSEGCRLAARNRGTLPPVIARMRRALRHANGHVHGQQLGGRLEAANMAGETEFAVVSLRSNSRHT
jgi:two-component sensor histidine kinase